MATIQSLLSALDEREIARRIGIPHDEARMQYQLQSNTVRDSDQFSAAVADYYNHHFTSCISNGGRLSSAEAWGRGKELLEREYRKRRGNIVSAYNNANDGTNGGMRVVLDTIAEGLKAEVIERYVQDVFDRHVALSSWEKKVDTISQFIAQCGPYLSSSIKASQPERYARDYSELIRSYVEGLQQTSAIFRRL